MNENIKRSKRFVKDIIKKILTRRYKISIKNLFKTKRYYIIRRNPPWAGFFANYLYVAAHIEYALQKGYIPVVDMENYPTLYNEPNIFNDTKNAWEYFFEQPFNVGLDEAYRSKNYILSDFSTMHSYLPYYEGKNHFEIDWSKGHKLSANIQKYIRIKDHIEDDIKTFINEYFYGKNILGVHYRGTDKKVKVKDHYLAASLDVYINTVKTCLSKHPIDKILLCTDEKNAIERFELEFPGMIFYSSAFRAEENDIEGIHIKKEVNRKNHNYLLGYEVLLDTVFLSKCDYFIFSHSNVANTAMFLNDRNYKEWFFVDN
ncbi:O-fucosyltransferase family protein [Priestia aryabhattai]